MTIEVEELMQQFFSRFPSDQECTDFMYASKWPSGFRCPRCDHREAYPIRTRGLPLYQCRACSYQASLTAGTVMEKSRTPLSKWLLAMFLICQSAEEAGLNAFQLSAVLGVTYKTAWSMLRKIKHCISQYDEQKPLDGDIVAGPVQYGFISGLINKPQPQVSPVAIGIGSSAERGTYVKVKIIPAEHTKSSMLLPIGKDWFTSEFVNPDERKIKRLVVIRQPFRDKTDMAVVRMLANKARKWICSTFGAIGKKHLQSYFDLFCFRFNSSQFCGTNAPWERLASVCLQRRLSDQNSNIDIISA